MANIFLSLFRRFGNEGLGTTSESPRRSTREAPEEVISQQPVPTFTPVSTGLRKFPLSDSTLSFPRDGNKFSRPSIEKTTFGTGFSLPKKDPFSSSFSGEFWYFFYEFCNREKAPKWRLFILGERLLLQYCLCLDLLCSGQCCGSTCFWTSWIRIRIH